MSDSLNFNIYNSLILAGIIQGIIFGFVVLFNKKYKNKSTLYLGALIISFSLNNLQFYFLDIALTDEFFLYKYVYIPWCLIAPTFFFLYVNKSLYPEKKITFKQKLLFIPFCMGLLFWLFFRTYVVNYYNKDDASQFLYEWELGTEFLAILFNQIIYVYVYLQIKLFEKNNSDFKFDTIQIRLNWLKQIVLFSLFITIIWLYLTFKETFSFYPLWIGISILTYWMGYAGIYTFGIIEERKKIKKHSVETKSTYSIIEKQKSVHTIALEHQINNQKRFLDINLSLDKIADELNLSKNYLSKIINTDLGIGFNEYINTLRVEEAKSNLLNPEFADYTLISIGLESGFNSKSVFNSVFKKHTGMTPSEFKKQNLS